MRAYHCAQPSYTTQHRTLMIIFRLILQTIIIAQMITLLKGRRAKIVGRLIANKLILDMNHSCMFIPVDAIFRSYRLRQLLLLSIIPDPGVQAVSPQVTVSHPPGGRLPLLSARPAVTFSAAEDQRPLAGTKLHCLVTEAHRCEQLAQGCYAALP